MALLLMTGKACARRTRLEKGAFHAGLDCSVNPSYESSLYGPGCSSYAFITTETAFRLFCLILRGEKRIICLPRVAFLGEEMRNGEEIVITAEAKAENGGHLTGAYRTLKPAGLSPTRAPGFSARREIIAPALTLNLP